MACTFGNCSTALVAAEVAGCGFAGSVCVSAGALVAAGIGSCFKLSNLKKRIAATKNKTAARMRIHIEPPRDGGCTAGVNGGGTLPGGVLVWDCLACLRA